MVIGKYVLGNSEVKKYSIDYSGWLGVGELIVGVTFDVSLATTPALTITDSVIDDTGTIVTFYAQGGDGKSVIPVGVNITTSFAQIKTDTINFASQVALGPGAPAGSLIVPSVVVGVFGTPVTGNLVTWNGANTLGSAATIGGSYLWTGLHSFGDGLSVVPGGTIKGLSIAHNAPSQTVAGINTFPFFYQASPSYMFNQITAIDGINVTTGGVNHGMSAALGIGMETGGATSNGTKVCLELQLVCDIPGANPTYGRDRACLSCDAFDSVGDGGTATDVIGHTKGTIFAAGFQTVAAAGALNLLTAAAVEFNVGIQTGASAWSRFGASAVSTGNLNAVSNMDAGFEVSSFSGSPAWKTGLMFSSFHGGPAVTATGTLIGDDGVAYTAASAIDLSHGTFTSWYIKLANFTVDPSGNIAANSLGVNALTVATDIAFADTAFMGWNTRGAIAMSADGVLELLNHAGTGFGRIQLGGTTSSFPAIKQNGAAINFRLADDSGDAAITAGSITAASGFGLKWASRSSMFSPVDGNIEFTNAAQNNFGLLQLGGTTSSFPAIKRNAAAINFRLADDSADAAITCGNLTSSGTASAVLVTAAQVQSTGASALLQFQDRSGSANWAWYATSNIARLFNGTSDVVSVDTSGNINAAGVLKIAGTQVVSTRATGWTVATGTPSRATFTTSGVTLATLAGVVMALEQDLIAHGLIGT